MNATTHEAGARGPGAAGSHPPGRASAERTRGAGRRRWSPRRRSATFAGYLFLLPWFLGLFGLVLGPMLASAYLSFTEYDLFTDAQWVGLSNYTEIIGSDPEFRQSVGVTFTYVLASVPLRLLFALALAVVLNRTLRGMAFYRSVMYLPSLLGGSVGVAVLWRQLFGRDGAVNEFLGLFGIDGPNWIADPDYSLMTIIVLAVWQFGSPMIIFLAGLRNIPPEMGEAALVDGAGPLRRFLSITIPLLTPIIFFNVVMQTIVAFQAFTPSFIISNGTGGPVGSTLFYTLYLYQKAFTEFEMGYASALAWILVAIIAAVTAVAFLSSRRWVFYADEGR
ncbi:carbohydrate ABC transporter permease [Brachybacterium sacelli]|uniref:Multiple sugar transport system permease protein n=1 Tax=Brachybacterium sacelli TaxID=173364 RepID=A0ABS4WZI4_9MICO|nr:sugar ABC transporter permease [Brachybacterium sacelli]MBP2381506.1 multiple sugar transport system permease protein [Brachybacterium sacelli]